LTWDGKNDAGKKVADGVYYAHVQSSDTLVVQDLLLVHQYEYGWTHAADEFADLTAADGSFEISQDCLPFDHVFDARDEDGEVIDMYTVSRWIHILAVDAADQIARQDSVFIDAELGAEVSIQFP
jgi:hypothetical protein